MTTASQRQAVRDAHSRAHPYRPPAEGLPELTRAARSPKRTALHDLPAKVKAQQELLAAMIRYNRTALGGRPNLALLHAEQRTQLTSLRTMGLISFGAPMVFPRFAIAKAEANLVRTRKRQKQLLSAAALAE